MRIKSVVFLLILMALAIPPAHASVKDVITFPIRALCRLVVSVTSQISILFDELEDRLSVNHPIDIDDYELREASLALPDSHTLKSHKGSGSLRLESSLHDGSGSVRNGGSL